MAFSTWSTAAPTPRSAALRSPAICRPKRATAPPTCPLTGKAPAPTARQKSAAGEAGTTPEACHSAHSSLFFGPMPLTAKAATRSKEVRSSGFTASFRTARTSRTSLRS